MTRIHPVQLVALASFAIMVLVVSVRAQDPPVAPVDSTPEPTPPAVRLGGLVEANTAFALNLQRDLSDGGDLVFSPFGLSRALAICLDGARGETARQLARTLRLPGSGSGTTTAFSELLGLQASDKRTRAIDLEQGVSLWVQEDGRFEFREGWIDGIESAFRAETFEIDLRSDSARELVTGWVDRRTRGRGVFPAEALESPELQALLVDTLYLKADWSTPFRLSATRDRPFHVSREEVVDVSTMAVTGTFRYRETEAARMIELPFKGGFASMIVILPVAPPDESMDHLEVLAGVEAALSADQLMSITDHMRSGRVSIRLPRFSVDSSLDLVEALQRLGTTDLFTDKADLSGMTGSPDLRVDDVLQNARIDVNEGGVEAVAVTVVGFATRSGGRHRGEVVEFRIDRPFMFLVRENATGTALLMGRITKPAYDGPEPTAD